MTTTKAKGFTLVEIIVVLVIVAILVAVTLPALTGYIEDAREKAVMATARNTFAEVNGVLQSPDTSKTSTYFLLNQWIAKPTNGYKIVYNGPTDFSVTLPSSTSHHDYAKNAIRKLMGTEPIQFGYRMYFAETSPGRYMLTSMEVFYKTPSNSSINSSKPDITFGNIK